MKLFQQHDDDHDGNDQTSSADKQLQERSFLQLIQLLSEAGYYRISISSLSKFDKVVGGLCWAITASNVLVDVDLFFRENAQVGERIRLAENIIRALRDMQCPHPLQAHQISGLDYPALVPVVQWLVGCVNDTRDTTHNVVRDYSEFQFARASAYTGSKLVETGLVARERRSTSKSHKTVCDVLASRYRVERRFAADQDTRDQYRGAAEDVRVRLCLLEYGDRALHDHAHAGGAGDRAHAGDAVNRAGAPTQGSIAHNKFLKQYRKAEREAASEGEQRAQQAKELECAMQQTAEGAPANVVLDYAAIRDAVSDAVHGDGISSSAGAGGILEKIQLVRRKVAQVEQQLGRAQVQRDAKSHERSERESELNHANGEFQELERKQAKIRGKLQLLLEHETSNGLEGDANKLEDLVIWNEQLRAQESQFKQACKSELARLNKRLAQLTAGEQQDGNDEENSRYALAERKVQKLQAKYDEARRILGEQSQAVSELSRRIDDIPTRGELIQYEKRFAELYQLLGSRLEENRKHIETFNVHEQVFQLMEKEVSILDSIYEQFNTAMNSKAAQEEFFSQLHGILESVKANLLQKTRSRDLALERREQRHEKYNKLVEQQRQYYKAVKDFQKQCDRNEKLEHELQMLSAR